MFLLLLLEYRNGFVVSTGSLGVQMVPSHGSVGKELSEWGVAGGNAPEWCVILRFDVYNITVTKGSCFIHSAFAN